MQHCKTCKREKPVNDFYANGRGGLKSSCKECLKQYRRERTQVYAIALTISHPSGSKRCSVCGEQKPVSDFYLSKGTADGFCYLCKPCEVQRCVASQERHPETRRRAEYKYNRTATYKAKQARRRERKRNAPINDFTTKQWQEMKAQYEYRCAYCGKRPERLTQDHVIPLLKGGSHTASNIVPACQPCNSRKHVRPTVIVPTPTPIQPERLLAEGVS
jgi:5-methylcytosine-specific restriction endonuclease McrA